MSKVIAVLTSGGDAPGMNAAIRGVYGRAAQLGFKVIGIRDGYTGLLREDMAELKYEDVERIIPMGGTVLGTSRCLEFHKEEVQKQAADICRKHGISAVVVIGGDGSFQGALRLYQQGINVVGIPGTIDCDIPCTEYTIGFDTAVNAALESIDRIHDTARSHKCYSIVEVMGRRAGYIAMWCGISASASGILIPEDKNPGSIVEQLRNKKKKSGVIVLAEGCGKACDLAPVLEKELGVHTRHDVLGFLQRGGSPTARDRVCGSRMGAFAVDLIERGESCHVVALNHGQLEGLPIEKALSIEHSFPKWLTDLGTVITTDTTI